MIDSDNLSIVSSCISFLDEHLKDNNYSAAVNDKNKQQQQQPLVVCNKMETTNEYSEPFDYLSSFGNIKKPIE